jgi:transposase
MSRSKAIKAVLSQGIAVTTVAAQFGVSRATVHRWLRAFDPTRPIASARPRKRGPKGRRWGDETVDTVINIIRDHPDWWGRRRVGAALVDRGIAVSERTVGEILPVARERLARAREAAQRARQVRNSRRVAAMVRRDQRDAERRDRVRSMLDEILVPGTAAQDAASRIAVAFAAKGWKVEVRDLTPELEELADAYLRAARAHSTYLDGKDKWLLEADRWTNRDHARVAAINHFVKRYKAELAALPGRPC